MNNYYFSGSNFHQNNKYNGNNYDPISDDDDEEPAETLSGLIQSVPRIAGSAPAI
jgi:hypothetical protein